MRRPGFFLVLAVLLMAAQETALADTFRLRSGETKRGRVLAEDEETILLDPGFNRPLTEIPKSSIAIYDREPASDIKMGGVSFYSTSKSKRRPRKETPPAGPFIVDETGTVSQAEAPAKTPVLQEVTMDILETLFQKQLDKNPKMREWLEKAAERSLQQAADLDKMVDAAKQG